MRTVPIGPSHAREQEVVGPFSKANVGRTDLKTAGSQRELTCGNPVQDWCVVAMRWGRYTLHPTPYTLHPSPTPVPSQSISTHVKSARPKTQHLFVRGPRGGALGPSFYFRSARYSVLLFPACPLFSFSVSGVSAIRSFYFRCVHYSLMHGRACLLSTDGCCVEGSYLRLIDS